jgi:hypothetical protein
MNTLEVAAAAVAWLLWWLVTRRRPPVLLAGAFAIVLALTAAESTQFMTQDEYGISGELMDAGKRGARQWDAGAMRTSLPVALAVVRVGERFGATPTAIRMALKALWWLGGTLLLLLAAREWSRVFAIGASGPARDTAAGLHGLAALSLLFLPVVGLATKTVSYDLLALVLPVMAVGLAARGWTEGPRTMALAVTVATLAAQEKFTASPVLLAVLLAAMLAERRRASGSGAPTSWWRAARVPLALSLAVIVVSAVAYAAVAGRSLTSIDPLAVFDPLASGSWIPLRFFFGVDPLAARPIGIALTLAGLLAAAALLAGLSARAERDPTRARRVRRVLGLGADGIPYLVALVGLVGLAVLQPYWAPFQPLPPGLSAKAATFNGIVLHFGFGPSAWHLAALMAYACALVVAAMPTSFWLMLGATTWLGRGRAAADRSTVADVVRLAAVALLVLAAAHEVPMAHRYLNLTILVLALSIVTDFVWMLQRRGVGRGTLPLVGGAVLLAALEAMPFAPLYATFRPFWLEYADGAMAQRGRLNPSWMGWGEEVMTAGKILRRECEAGLTAAPCDSLALHPVHYGLWLAIPEPVRIVPWDDIRGREPMGATDYYVVNRSFLIQGVVPVPTIAPDFTVAARGYGMAWIWRGDRLAAAGYTFGR